MENEKLRTRLFAARSTAYSRAFQQQLFAMNRLRAEMGDGGNVFSMAFTQDDQGCDVAVQVRQILG